MTLRRGILLLQLFGLYLHCARQTPPNRMSIAELGFTMTLPAKWQQGKPLLSSGNRYAVQANGRYCFASVKESYPFGAVREFSLEGFSSLEEYVRSPGNLFGAAVSERPISVSGRSGLEIVGKGLGEKQVPVKGIYWYIQDQDRLIVISFVCPERDFGRYEPMFREALATARLASGGTY
ncbi:MAG: hypothetical protein ABIK62_07340 [candidate division WOR-3 bacterium]